MKHRAAITALLLIFLTVGAKWCLEKPVNFGTLDVTLLPDIESALERQGYQMLPPMDTTSVFAAKQACVVAVGVSQPEGGNDLLFARNYRSMGDILFLYRGQLLEKRPGARGLVDRALSRIFSLTEERSLFQPFQLAISPSCNRDELMKLDLEKV